MTTKKELVEKAEAAGIDATGTKAEIEAALESREHPAEPNRSVVPATNATTAEGAGRL